MSTDTVEISRTIAAPSATVYNFLADYRNGHAKILPRKYFSEMTVEDGGIGEGTRIRYELKAYGTRRFFQAVVEEPEPGRRLVEIDLVSGAYTTFTVEDRGRGGSEVTIRTRVLTRSGLAGRIEALLIKRLLRNIFSEELRLLSRAVRFPAIRVAPVHHEEAATATFGSSHGWLEQGTKARLVEAP